MHRAGAALATALLAAAATLSGCSGDAGEPAADRSPTAPAAPAAPAAAGTAGTSGTATTAPLTSRPELRGQQDLVLRTGREVFVLPSCTPDADGQRPCWGETALPYDLAGEPVTVRLTGARTDLDPLTDSWFVELTIAAGATASTATALEQVASTGGDSRLALASPDGVLLALAPAGTRLDGDRLRLPGLDKAAAWALVAEVVELAAR